MDLSQTTKPYVKLVHPLNIQQNSWPISHQGKALKRQKKLCSIVDSCWWHTCDFDGPVTLFRGVSRSSLSGVKLPRSPNWKAAKDTKVEAKEAGATPNTYPASNWSQTFRKKFVSQKSSKAWFKCLSWSDHTEWKVGLLGDTFFCWGQTCHLWICCQGDLTDADALVPFRYDPV